jgi:molybdopterin-binding protein
LILEEATDNVLVYRGFAHLPDADVAAEARVELPAYVATAILGEGATRELERACAAQVRAVVKAALAEIGSAPRRVARWRP